MVAAVRVASGLGNKPGPGLAMLEVVAPPAGAAVGRRHDGVVDGRSQLEPQLSQQRR
jgi:hypothetical protein